MHQSPAMTWRAANNGRVCETRDATIIMHQPHLEWIAGSRRGGRSKDWPPFASLAGDVGAAAADGKRDGGVPKILRVRPLWATVHRPQADDKILPACVWASGAAAGVASANASGSDPPERRRVAQPLFRHPRRAGEDAGQVADPGGMGEGTPGCRSVINRQMRKGVLT